jgi:dihydroorotate dehydrogenase (NAD+) catalytic subunit
MFLKNKIMLYAPFYDPEKSYEENCKKGPFGVFADREIFEDKKEPNYNFFGRKVNSPFGIPAGPLPNGKFIKAAFDKGFDICVYKTVRTRPKKSNDWPNVLPVNVVGDLTLGKAQKGLVIKKQFTEPLAITNSFGNPSFDPKIWQADIINTLKAVNQSKGKVMCGMIEGTRLDANSTEQDFLDDWALAARLMNETGIHVIEANFSCPNEGDKVKRLLCFDVTQSRRIAEAI